EGDVAMIIYVAALLQAAPVAAPPLPSSPPIFTREAAARSLSLSRVPRESYMVEVEARSGTALLWSGALRVSTNTGAAVRNETIEASHPACALTNPSATKQFR